MKQRAPGIHLLLLAVTLGLLAWSVKQAVDFLGAPMTTATAYLYSVDLGVELSGLMVRQEQVLPDEAGGLLRLQRTEGERVSAGGLVAAVYADQASLDRQAQIDSLDSRIAQLEYLQATDLSYESSLKLDGQIQESVLELWSALAAGRLDLLEGYGGRLRTLVLRRDRSGEDPAVLAAEAEALRQERASLQSQSAGSVRRIVSPAAGLWSAAVDGYETVLSPAVLPDLRPSGLAALQPDASVHSSVGKLVLGDDWYYAASVTTADAKLLQSCEDLSLRFSRDVERELPVTLQSVSDPEGGRVVAVFHGRTYLSQLTMLRQQSADVLYGSVEGIRVPKESLRVVPQEVQREDGTTETVQVTGIYCVMGAAARFKPVEVLYNGDGFLLVRSASDRESLRLRPGDETILTARGLYDGKVVREG